MRECCKCEMWRDRAISINCNRSHRPPIIISGHRQPQTNGPASYTLLLCAIAKENILTPKLLHNAHMYIACFILFENCSLHKCCIGPYTALWSRQCRGWLQGFSYLHILMQKATTTRSSSSSIMVRKWQIFLHTHSNVEGHHQVHHQQYHAHTSSSREGCPSLSAQLIINDVYSSPTHS